MFYFHVICNSPLCVNIYRILYYEVNMELTYHLLPLLVFLPSSEHPKRQATQINISVEDMVKKLKY